MQDWADPHKLFGGGGLAASGQTLGTMFPPPCSPVRNRPSGARARAPFFKGHVGMWVFQPYVTEDKVAAQPITPAAAESGDAEYI